MPAPGAPEPMGRVPFSPDDASPSRARLGRVAAMIADAERAAPGAHTRHQDAGVVIPMLARRPRPTLPRPRSGGDVLSVARGGAQADVGTVRST